MRRVAIVGGGITGLAAARELERTTDAEIDLYEASARLGGKLETERIDGLLVERGPDCFFTRKPGVLETVRELGLVDRLVAPIQREFGMLVGGTIHRVPAGLVALNAVRAEAVGEATFLSDEAKARALAEPSMPRGEGGDESIRAFFARRFGPEFTRLVAEPLLGGTHGGDADRLSMAALFPAYLEWERSRGVGVSPMRPTAVPTPSPTVFHAGARSHPSARASPLTPSTWEATPAERTDASASPPSADPPTVPPSARASLQGEPSSGAAFLSFDGGMGVLAEALGASLTRTRVHLGAAVEALPRADQTLVALPANRAASLLPGIGLEGIRHGTTSILTLAFRREEVGDPLGGTGFLVPAGEPFPFTGATWSSSKWPGRAPEDEVLLRLFMRGRGDPEAALAALTELLGIRGTPLYREFRAWTDAQPQYEVGHLERVEAIERALPPNVWIAGTSFRGVGVPDCLRQGGEAARRIGETL